MSASIKVELSPSAIALLQRFDKMPSEFPHAVARGMTKALEVVTGRIQEKRLSGKGPFPVEEHRLGQVTQQLVRSTRAAPATVVSEGTHSEVVGAIGASVIYAAVHEFGFQGEVNVKASAGRKAYKRNMNMPERAPFRTGINENLDYISDEIGKELAATLEGASA
jgi:phage gpG-like protein